MPHQPMGLGTVVQVATLYPRGSCLLHIPAHAAPCHLSAAWLSTGFRAPLVLYTLSQKLSEVSNKDGLAIKDTMPASSLPWLC